MRRPSTPQVLLLLLLLALPAQAGDAPQPPPGPQGHELRHTGPLFLAGELGTTLVLLAGLTVVSGDPAASCRWCEPGGFDLSVRELLLVEDRRAAARWSHVLSMGATGGLALASHALPAFQGGPLRHVAEDTLITLNAALLTTALSRFAKKVADRQRPGFYFGEQARTEAADKPREENLSFFSGDTSWAFSVASSATALAWLRGNRNALWIGVAGGSIATAAGLLRSSADMHWGTDVLTGAAVGTLVGAGLPLLLHGREGGPLVGAVLVPQLAPGRAGLSLATSF